jgi:hypothetical protein
LNLNSEAHRSTIRTVRWLAWNLIAPVLWASELSSIPVHTIRITADAASVGQLRASPREDVSARVSIDDRPGQSVRIHLKGSTGSFSTVDDRPGLTVRFDREDSSQRGLGHRTLHLNNSVEDPSLLQEAFAATVFREAGIPAPEVGHARILWNGTERGLYVVVAGWDPEFFATAFPGRAVRRLKEGDTLPAVDALLKQLASEQGQTWAQLQRVVEVDSCLRYLAVEGIFGHRDGYLAAGNNHRLVEVGDPARMMILPHGMDQFVGTPEFPWRPAASGAVARAVLSSTEGRARYEQKVTELLNRFGGEAAWLSRLNALAAQFESGLTPAEAKRVNPAREALRERLRERYQGLIRQRAAVETSTNPSQFSVGRSQPLGPWSEPSLVDEAVAYSVAAGGSEPATFFARLPHGGAVVWRSTERLEPGRYQIRGRIRTAGLARLAFGKNHGAVLRLAGREERSAPLLGNQPWTDTVLDFEVRGPGEQEIVVLCEVRGSAGEAWFDQRSLRVERLR